ncbi:hypothetical protein [Pseudoxanthomonas sp. PXM02]|uniref:hypothetical protein n=1 Tax=Pseudoxanthomonas sp. PXM02 TaxID=2769294 RepID=UPI001783C1BD|nr:hypothetical protein [Pseudoxanthomonas sp. PXM02]MBD9478104.1 hypothetical protein [Pseudoxanthomonas sp. PXM02]
MNLSEAFRQFTTFPDDGIIFAERVGGVFRPDSRCVVLVLSDEQLQLQTSVVAAQLAPGFEYFLEVETAAGFAVGASTPAQVDEALALLIRYAENDA